MSDTSTGKLDACGCCGEELPAPPVRNRPGLDRLAYRAGAHGELVRAMIERLPSWTTPSGEPASAPRPLAALTTRDTADPVIAMLDAWACVADVLTFYQERIANEGYLRTATERRSVLELARSIGYELKPGVAASTYLAFTVEDAPGAPGEALIEERVRVLSVPGQGERPQTFETIESIAARAEWNALKPRTTRKQDLAIDSMQAYFAGIATQLQPGDVILLVGAEREKYLGSEAWDVRIVSSVTTDAERSHTVVTWQRGLGRAPSKPAAEPRAYVFRVRASLFGHSAAEWGNLPKEIKALYTSSLQAKQWPEFSIDVGNDERSAEIYLDASYPQMQDGSWLALVQPSYVELYRASQVRTVTRTGFGLVSKSTRIEPDVKEHLSWFRLRSTTVLAHSVELAIAEEPDPTALGADEDPYRDRRYLELDRRVTRLESGRLLVVSGQHKRQRAQRALVLLSEDGYRTVQVALGDSLIVVSAPLVEGVREWLLEDRNGFRGRVVAFAEGDLAEESAAAEDPVESEVAILAAVEDTEERTTLELESPLAGWYDRDTVAIFANVVRGTHGETVKLEPLGSGDATLANQRFRLAKPPLTYVPAETASGASSTLEIWVDGVLWNEAPFLHGSGASDETYAVRLDDGGTTRVLFGDGATGARLPTGLENVRATYRTGIGLAGEVDAGKLTLLQTRPLGVRGVTNPLPATGSADPESLDDARSNAPVTVLTLDRIVALRDYEDFARAFAGIGKAQAVALWNGETQVVHLTVGTSTGEPVEASSDSASKLRLAIDLARDPAVPVVVQGYRSLRFFVEAKILVNERHDESTVHAAIRTALESAFDFDHRQFGQAVTQAEIVALMQRVEGVDAVDLDALYREGSAPSPATLLTAAAARRSGASYEPGELLLLMPDGVMLSEMPS